MRIVVDRDLCEGHAQCCAAAPDVFKLDADYAMYLATDHVGEDQRDAVLTAVTSCPRQALRVVEAPDGGQAP
jgi:ferredoxin